MEAEHVGDGQHVVGDVGQRRAAASAWLEDATGGMPTRLPFLDQAHRLFQGGGGNPAVLVVELDGLRDVQTVLGDDHAQTVVAEVGRRLREAVGGWPVGTLGEERFCIAMMAKPFMPAHHLGRTLRSAIARPMDVDGVGLRLSSSVGVAQGDSDAAVLLRRAINAATDASRHNTGLELHQAENPATVRRRLLVAAALSEALEDPAAHNLRAAYQPIVDPDGMMVKAEALVRWDDPRMGVVSPAEFVPLAEQTGLVDPMLEIVLGQALAGCRAWQDSGLRAGVAVNLSAVNLRQPLLVSELTAALERSGLDARQVTLEVTETAVIDDGRNAIRILSDLRAAGFDIALDDFGVGYSSLARLRDLPVSTVKLDQTFARTLTSDRRTGAIVKATVDVCRVLDMVVVAEGIETPEQAAVASGIGVDLLQGYLFSDAVMLDDLLGGGPRATAVTW